MKNFIFKSQQDFHKIVFNKLETIQSEQRHARMDLVDINRLLKFLINDKKLQSQVDDYFEDDIEDTEHIPEVKDDSSHGN